MAVVIPVVAMLALLAMVALIAHAQRENSRSGHR